MGYFDGLAASSFKEEGGQYYLMGFGKPRRFLTQDGFEAARKSLGTYYTVGLPLIVVLAVAGRQIGYGWTVLGGVLLVSWLMIFGRKRLTANTIVEGGVSDGIGERLDRIAANSGVATLRWLLAGSSALTLAGLWLRARSIFWRSAGRYVERPHYGKLDVPADGRLLQHCGRRTGIFEL